MMVVMMVWRRLGCWLFDWLDHSRVAADKGQRSYTGKKHGGNAVGSNHLSFSPVFATLIKLKHGCCVRCV
jgi:hypothetical protein